jgi:hypothetical protein
VLAGSVGVTETASDTVGGSANDLGQRKQRGPAASLRALGKPAECGGCIRLFVERMRSDARMAVPAELRWLRHRSGGHAPAKPVTMTQLQKKLDTTR